ncbi:MAG: ATP-binding protein [Methylocella sp.]
MSLRRSIILWITLLMAVVGVIAVATTYELTLYEAGQFMDDQLRQFADASADTDETNRAAAELQEPEDRFTTRAWSADGRLVHATRDGPPIDAPPSYQGFRTFDDGESWRVFVSKDAKSTIMVAQRMSARGEIARHAALEVAVPILLILPLAWSVVVLSIGRVMRSLAKLGETIAIRSVETKAPLSYVGIPREILPLIGAMNTLIGRQQMALDQQRRFVADSAHELRTPLTALQIQIDNLHAAGSEEAASLVGALREGSSRVNDLLNQLLRLASFDTPPTNPALEEIDLVDLVTFCVAGQLEVADASSIDLGLTTLQRYIVLAVRSDIQMLLSNIIHNAIRYTSPGGKVDCSVEQHGTGARLIVADTGPGVAESDIPRLTDRFFRAASIDKTGSGLGLSIAKAIAERYNLQLSFENRTSPSGLRVTVYFAMASASHRAMSI